MNTEQKIIKNKVGLLKLSEMLGSVLEACQRKHHGQFYPAGNGSTPEPPRLTQRPRGQAGG